MCISNKRREMDVMGLMMIDYKVELINDSMHKFYVQLHGPKESLYEGGVWRVKVGLPNDYPYSPPSIEFVDRIYHPNINRTCGSVCLNVIKSTWSPMFDLVNVFEVFLPQLLLYPNPSDPSNGEAAALMRHDRIGYEQRVKEYCVKYAKPENVPDEEPSDDEISEDEYASSDEEVVGKADP